MKRALAEVVAGAGAPVVVLEGAHGVGKTSLVKNEAAFRDFHYVTLADEEEFARASAQPSEWVASLQRPVVIDEAHRVESLLAVVRQVAPKKRGKRPRFVLLTPETLRSEKATGPKPERFTLFPLTQAEIEERPGCIIDDLFDGSIFGRFRSFHTRNDLRTRMRIGGFPYRVTHPVSSLSQEDGGLPAQNGLRLMRGEASDARISIEQLIVKAIMERLLPNPGISLGVDALANSCHVDAATLTAYLQGLEDRHLFHRLTMLDKKQSRKWAFAKTRIHPIDTSVAVEALRDAGRDIAVELSAFAKVLRTLCVNQLVPAVQWASEPTECHHWKRFERRMREVDLVLVRGERLVGITVRNSLAARSDTIGALRFLAEDERFTRGFIIYMGLFPRRLTENIWALPVSALWEDAAFYRGGSASEVEGEPGAEAGAETEAGVEPEVGAEAGLEADAELETEAGDQGLQRPQGE